MTPKLKQRSLKTDLLIAAVIVVAGLGMSGASLARIATTPQMQLAQATPPLQSTPGAETKPSAPAQPTTTGMRPTEVPPQPAQPDADAQKAGATSLPQAPAEKTAAPIPEK
jgi:hypothetical protein